jgi:septal ring factor EnvC (AmiA/AmiB activator)
MKTIVAVVVLLFIGATGLALADTTSPAAKPAMHHPRIHEVHHRMKDINERIKEGVKSGKMTKEQAAALRQQLKSIQEEMEADYKTNGKRMLTEDQKKQLNQELDQISKSVYEDKHDQGSTDANGAPSGTSAPAGNGAAAGTTGQ